MKSGHRLIFAGLVVCTVAVLAGLAYSNFSPWLNRSGSTLLGSGTVEATEALLGFVGSGRIDEVTAVEGERVSAGQILARLDSLELKARRVQAQAQVAAADAALRELESGARSEELAQAQAALNAMSERLSDARRDLKRTTRLVKGGAIGKESLDKALSSVRVLTSQKEEALQQLKLLQAGPRIERIEAQRAQLAQSEAAIGVLDATMANTILHSPFAGIVSVRHREPGEIVSPGVPVYTVMNPGDRWVRVYVPENQIGRISLGDTVDLQTDSFPDKFYQGVISHIASEAEFTPKTVQTTEERVRLVYAVKVRIADDTQLQLKPGLPVDVYVTQAAD